VRIPDSRLVREVTQLIRDTESDLLFHHSVRVYFWGALTGNRMGLSFDPELLYTAAMFHDIGLTARNILRRMALPVARPVGRGHHDAPRSAPPRDSR
jgi:HD superfamily phosphodiesterase